jgi:hypothetical protein
LTRVSSGSASDSARADSRLSFQAISAQPVSASASTGPANGTTSVGRAL